jgi:hypothetical protein
MPLHSPQRIRLDQKPRNGMSGARCSQLSGR